MRQRWQSLAPREQRLVLFGGGALLLAVLYWGFWHPLQSQLEQRRTRVAAQQATLSWMRAQGQRVLSLRQQGGSAQVDLSASLESVVSQSAQQARISLTRLQSRQTQVQVEIARLPFDRWLAWVGKLESQYGVTVSSVELQAMPANPGEVQVRHLVLERRS